ncbi:MAG TPA: NAD(+) diphosphatase [Steroidobacteraceae bacterium]|nr:NAD(+) diphosphatase [Steroidobacteraceae bacterium]
MPARQPANVFAGPYVDRASALRKDAAWLDTALGAADSRFVPVWRTQNLIDRGPTPAAVLLPRAALRALDASEAILLGRFRGAAAFAVELMAQAPAVPGLDAEFTDLRLAGGLLPPDEAGLLAYARAMVWWRHRHRNCGVCGAPTVASEAGHVMTCTRADCATEFFPRIDPAIIVLVTDGERALLGRQASWPTGRYSTIAGFVEPGESLEDAVVREVREETAVEVIDLEYQSSQPWPFPSSLMVGFVARARDTSVACPDGELEDARWFTRAELATGTPKLPPPQSISFRLIADWYEGGTGRRLIDEPGAAVWSQRR